MFKRIPGTKDILPAEIAGWEDFERISRVVFARYNFRQIRTPLLEEAQLFDRSLGDTAEIVQKQMFLIRHADDVYALRPEGTASVVRAYIENNLDKEGTAKLFYTGPMFRCERPQKGRLRQFHHIGAEVIGSVCPGADVEVISLAAQLLKEFGITGATLMLNSLGCAHDKQRFADRLRGALEAHRQELCPECHVRLEKNVLRILDCKQQGCQNVVKGIVAGAGSHLCEECAAHFNRVTGSLDALGISYELAPQLVRGLDYYTRTVFEFKHSALGAQDAIGAGGRYDNLVKQLGGPDAGSCGFAFGVERLMLAREALQIPAQGVPALAVYVATMGDETFIARMKLVHELRAAGIAADTDYTGASLKGMLRRANDAGARFVAIIGEDELKNNTVTLKDMASKQQRQVAREQLIKELLSNVKDS
jgi:histidyl-tRNA synthetase